MEKSLALILASPWLDIRHCLRIGWHASSMIAQRRSLRKALRLAEQEVQALRSLPAQDAD
ncbi:MAG: hypothetical protein R3F24_11860 [Gammaproteobacteria bacterium]